MRDSKKQLWIWLTTRPLMTAEKITALLEVFGSVEEIYATNGQKIAEKIRLSRSEVASLSVKALDYADKIIDRMDAIGGTILHFDDPQYPDLLRRVFNPPYVLYLRGKIPKWERIFGIGVVGTRECTGYGTRMANVISQELAARGVCIVSGLARGIDAAASKGALSVNGYSIGVLGCGVDVVYPPENAEIYAQMIERATILSEYPPGSPPLGWHFPERNRIMSGLSHGVLAIEAPKRSGTLITVQYALESGKDVFAVPGPVGEKDSEGTNLLIQQGAKLVTCGQDILDEYPRALAQLLPPDPKEPEKIPVRKVEITDSKYQELSEEERLVISLLLESDLHIEQIGIKSGMDIAKINAILPMLEMYDMVCKLPGDYYQLKLE